MHLPQSTQTRYELESLTLVKDQIISPAKCKPIISPVQDTISGTYLLTDPRTRIDKKTVCDLMMDNGIFMGGLDKEEYTGTELYSLILPTISMIGKNYKITNGFIEYGQLTKDLIGPKSNGLIQTVHNQYGTEQCKVLLDNMQRLIMRWLIKNSFSIGMGDTIPSKYIQERTEEIIESKLNTVYEIIEEAYQGIYNPNLSDFYLKKSLERDLMGKLRGISAITQKLIADELTSDNRIKIANTSGAKGNAIQIGSIMTLVGQQDIIGQRVLFKYTDRTLPHFHKYDTGPASRGFIRNPYYKGMSAIEVFYHAMGSRSGLINTAISTAKSGYIQRRLMKAMEDISVCYDGTIRNNAGNIIQFVYGNDGYDPMKLEKEKLTLMELNNKEFDNTYKHEKETPETKQEYDELIAGRKYAREVFKPNMTTMDSSIFSPVNYYRLIHFAKYKFQQTVTDNDLSANYVIEHNNKLCDFMTKYTLDKSNLYMLKILLKNHLASKRCIYEYKLNKEVYDYIYKSVKNKLLKSFITPGETVGPLAAQSLGEPSTQLTLDSFHTAGSGSFATTQGVPRLDELINLTKKMKTPSMKIYLRPEYADNYDIVDKIGNIIQFTKIKDILSKTEILYESDELKTTDDEDLEFINVYNEFNDLMGVDKIAEESLSPWVLRFEFDRELMLAKNIYMSQIQEIIMNKYSDNDINCIFSDDNSGNMILRLRVRNEKGEFLQFLKKLENQIINLTLRGVSGILNHDKFQEKYIQYNPDGSWVMKDQWVIITDGSNLTKIYGNEYIDESKTISNDIMEIYEIFGIEAVRQMLINEFEIIFSSEGVNNRHIQMLSDVMTYKGKMMSIARHGLSKNVDSSLINKLSFEELMDIVVRSSIFSEKDNMKGVSANVMFGQYVPIGTNSFDVLFDDKMFIEHVKDEIVVENDIPIDGDEINEMIDNYSNSLKDNDFNIGYNLSSEYKLHNVIDDSDNDDIIIV